MASTFNAFEALKASGELSAKSSSKKSKKNKSKSKAQAKAEDDQPVNHDLAVPSPAADAASEQTPALDEGQLLERAAKQAESGTNRARLWKEWIAHAQDKQKGAQFKQTLLGSRALEFSLENCLTASLTSQQDALLVQLLTLLLPFGDGFVTNRLHSAVQQLSAVDLDAAPDVKTLSAHSLHQLTAWLKTQGPSNGGTNDAETWLARMSEIDRNILQKQAALKNIGPTVSKEHVTCAWQMLKLQEEKVDLLKPGAIPSSTATQGAPRVLVACLQNLREAIGTYLQHDAYSHSNGGGYDFERQQAQSAYQREDSVLAQKAGQLAAQVKQLESQLRTLRSELADVEEKRAALHKLQSTAAGGTESRPQAQPKGLPLSSAHAALEAAESLSSLVEQTGDGRVEQQLMLAKQSQGSAPVEYTGVARHYLAMSSALLGELPQKVESSKQRIARAEKMMALSTNTSKILDTYKKQKEESERQLADNVKWAEDAVHASKQVLKSVTDRYATLRQVAPPQADLLGQELRDVEELCARIQLQYHQVTRAVQAEAAPAPVAPVVPPVVKAPGAPVAALQHPAAPIAHVIGNLNLGPTIPNMVNAALPVAAGLPAELARAPVAAPVRPPVGNAVVAPPARAPSAAASGPVVAAPHTNGGPARPARSWAKLEAPVASADIPLDESLPTPAEAFKEGEAAEGSKQGSRRRRA